MSFTRFPNLIEITASGPSVSEDARGPGLNSILGHCATTHVVRGIIGQVLTVVSIPETLNVSGGAMIAKP